MTYVNTLTPLYPNGDVQKGKFLNTGGTTTGDFFALIDEAISSADDTNYVRGSANGNDADSNEIVIFNITNMPSDFISMVSLTYNVRYRQFNRVDDTVGLQFWVEKSDGTDLTNVVTVAGITTTTFTNTGAVNFTLTTAGTNATKTDWDDARLVFAQTNTTSMAADGAFAAVSAVELTGTYTAYRPELKYYNGSTWVWKPLFVRIGGQWVYKTLKRWDGSQWVREP